MTEKSKNMKSFSVFKKKLQATIVIDSLKLLDVPTQTTKIYVSVKQWRRKQRSTSEDIIKNTVEWDDTITLENCRIPVKAPSKNKFFLRFSFRLEDASSGHKFTRFGFAELDLTTVQQDKKFTFESILHDCRYNSKFCCMIAVKLKDSVPPTMSTKGIKRCTSLTEQKSNCFQQFRSKYVGNTINESYPFEIRSLEKYSYSSSNDSNEEENENNQVQQKMVEKLPFSVTQSKMELLTKQVDDIINVIITKNDELYE